MGDRIDGAPTFPFEVAHGPHRRYARETPLWHLVFDHRSSAAVENDSDPATCDGAGRPLCVYLDPTTDPDGVFPHLFTRNDPYESLVFHPDSLEVAWNQQTGCLKPVPTLPTTWGRLKTLYRE